MEIGAERQRAFLSTLGFMEPVPVTLPNQETGIEIPGQAELVVPVVVLVRAQDYRGEFDALLETAIGLAGGRADHVQALSIPDWGVTPYARENNRDRVQVGQELDAYNAAAAAICAEHGVSFIDITDLSRVPGGEAVMLVDDGLHPSAAMYAEWAAQALPVARKLLANA